MWWPHLDSMSDLIIEDTETGWSLSAPEDTECANWLSYFSQSEEHRSFFEEHFNEMLLTYCKKLEENGKD